MSASINPRSNLLRTALPNEHVANFLQGRKDMPTLLGTIEYMDAEMARLESELRAVEHQRPGCPKKSDNND